MLKETRNVQYPSIEYAGRLSRRVWTSVSRLFPEHLTARVNALFKLIRPGRVMMVSLLTWVSANVAGVAPTDVWLITLGGMFLAMTGFAVDMYTDREADKQGDRAWPTNPISAAMMGQAAARRWIIFFVLAGISLCWATDPFTLVPATGLLITYWGLAAGVFDGPIGRAVTLGLLQAWYVLLAAAATGTITVLMMLVASVFLAAMFGARAAADIRDLPSDALTDTRNLAKVYGIRTASWILPIAITIAAAISLYIYSWGVFDRDYLIWTSLGFGLGLIMAWSFPFRPTPNYAFILGLPFWGTGILYMLALFLGSR